ncbi:hypothetical protein MASR2M15_15990 [Anaerolineales bacterium]
MNNSDTEQNQPVVPIDVVSPARDLDGPPKILWISIIAIFFLVICGLISSVVIFREVLQPSQQQRVLGMAPFMHVFLPPTPQGGILPTVAPQSDTDADPMDLLNIPINTPVVTIEVTAEITEAVEITETQEATQAVVPNPTEAVQEVVTEVSVAPTLAPTETLIPSSANISSPNLPLAHRLFGIRHEKQTWNNCGPATVTMALSFYGWQNSQTLAASYLKPNKEDKNVSPEELETFVNEQTGVNAILREGGSIKLLKQLLANDVPVIIETGASFEAYSWVGHYRVVVAYDDSLQQLYFYDSFLGDGDNQQGINISYQDVDKNWKDFNRSFIVIYPNELEASVQTILGPLWDASSATETALKTAQDEVRLNPNDAFAWFNMGTSLTHLKRFEEASIAFDQARRLELPWRMLWYQFEMFEAYFETGRYDDVLSLTKTNISNAPELEEMYYWQGRVFEAQGQPEKARSSFITALNYNPYFKAAADSLAGLR